MRFSVWPGPMQTWESALALATRAERTGWDGVWFADHFMANADDPGGDTLECWAAVAAFAAAVPRVRLGTSSAATPTATRRCWRTRPPPST